MKTAIFFGAGASAAEGAPIQNALFKNFFSSARGARSETLNDMRVVLRDFFKTVFGVAVRGGAEVHYPTFEEALGVLELSAMRCESLRGFNLDPDSDPQSASIRRIRHYLILAMGKAIDDGLKERSPGTPNRPPGERPHQRLIRSLAEGGLLDRTIFVSANYDLLIDEALGRSPAARGRAEMVDYGVEFTRQNFPYEAERVDPAAFKLYKIHGSLGWLYCPTCNNLKRFEYKVVLQCIFNIDRARCTYCHTLMSPMIVPPTYYKDMSKVFLSTIWNKTECGLRDVEHIIFCGYSFPDADMHIKYLLKRVQTNRKRPSSIRFTVINKYDSRDEAARYRRFLGDRVDYKGGATFEEFAERPQNFY